MVINDALLDLICVVAIMGSILAFSIAAAIVLVIIALRDKDGN